jgi:hypothetical protein
MKVNVAPITLLGPVSASPRRPQLVANAGDTSAVFLVLQGMGEHDFVPLT